MDRTGTLQEKLIAEIRGRFPRQADMVTELTKLLSVNKDGVYRRLRGDTALSANEVQLLANHFYISIDNLLENQPKKTYFFYNHYQQPIKTYVDYLDQIYQQIAAFRKLPGFRVQYASREIPVLIYMMFPRLLAFKLYVYGLTTWEFPYLQDQTFSFDLISHKEQEIAEAAAELYCSVDSTDFWTVSILEPSLNQVEYLTMAEKFPDLDTAIAICDEIRVLVNHARQMAERGQKFMPDNRPSARNGKFDLFYNELASTNNTILALSDTHSGLFHTLDTPNFLSTTDRQLCALMERWFEQITSHSTAISVHSERDRNFYFNRLEEKVSNTIERLEHWFQRRRSF